MEIKSINFYGNDGWENQTTFGHTPSSYLHIPRVGDKIENKYGSTYKVTSVEWNLPGNIVNIYCERV